MIEAKAASIRIKHLLHIHRYELAAEQLKEALLLFPDDPDLLICQALYFDQKGYKELALEAIEICLSKNYFKLEAALLRIELLRNLKRYHEAEADILELIKLFPESSDLYTVYGWILLDVFQFEKSSKIIEEALRLDPNNPYALRCMVYSEILVDGKKNTEEIVAKLIEHDPESTSNLYTLCARLLSEHKYKQASEVAQILIRRSPNDQDLINLAIEAKVAGHLLNKPFMILNKFGWAGSAGLWIGFIIIYQITKHNDNSNLASSILIVYVSYCLLSWVISPILKNWYTKRGI